MIHCFFFFSSLIKTKYCLTESLIFWVVIIRLSIDSLIC